MVHLSAVAITRPLAGASLRVGHREADHLTVSSVVAGTRLVAEFIGRDNIYG